MGRFQRVGQILVGLAMIVVCVVLLAYPQDGLVMVAWALFAYLILSGLGRIWYYLTMARHMVRGLPVLYRGILSIDLGIFAMLVVNEPNVYIALYLVGINVFAGATTVARSLEHRYMGGHWRLDMIHGIVNVLLALSCLFFLNSPRLLITVYCIGLFSSAIMRIVQALRSTDIIYVP